MRILSEYQFYFINYMLVNGNNKHYNFSFQNFPL